MTRLLELFVIKTTENFNVRNERNVLVSESLPSDESSEAFSTTTTASGMLSLAKLSCDVQTFSNRGLPIAILNM